jgi:hypothetical protein
MRRTVLALGIVMLPLSLGCGSNDSDIAGKAVIVINGETLTIDTGNDGKNLVNESDDWGTICGTLDGVEEVYLEDPRRNARFTSILIFPKTEEENVHVRADGNDYDGICLVTNKVKSNDPYEADVSVEPCDLKRVFDDAPARLESAFFHVESCE